MVIRELLDVFEKEIAGHRAALKRVEAAKARVLSCCRQAKAPELKVFAPEEEPCREGRARAAA